MPSLRILAIETSGRIGSVALGAESGLLRSATMSGSMTHASELLPLIEELLAYQAWPADSLSDIFVSIGPGSFTGLRIGVACARTLAWSTGSRIVAVPTLDCTALNALDADPCPEHLAVLLDAKRDQVFAAGYTIRDGRCHRLTDAALTDPHLFLASCPRPLHVLGEGVPHHRDAILANQAIILDESLWAAGAERVYQLGLELAREGRYCDPGDLLPRYIRRPEAEEKWRKLHPEKFPDSI